MATTTATGIRGISLVCVPTPDQDKAIEFYESLGSAPARRVIFDVVTGIPDGGHFASHGHTVRLTLHRASAP